MLIGRIREVYIMQEAVIRRADGVSDPGIIGRGVRQGYLLSPLLFFIYAEAMTVEALGRLMKGLWWEENY